MITMTATPTSQLDRFARQVRSGRTVAPSGACRLGVDLGTGNIVLAVVDGDDHPVGGAWLRSTVVRDGVVVDWLGAVRAVGQLRDTLAGKLGVTFREAAVAIPPGIDAGTTKVFTNVLEACGLEASEVVDEPVAAATALGVTDGVVIDVGHGTTGVSILRDSEVLKSVDQATGGHHMTLVISGALGIDYEAAEQLKRDPAQGDLVIGLIRPTLEKMATIAAEATVGYEEFPVYLVGGSSSYPQSPAVFEGVLRRPVTRPDEPLFPTPLGTAMRRNR